MLSEELLPECQAVNALTLHGRIFTRCHNLTRSAVLALDETRCHEQPLERLNPHEGIRVEDWQVFDLLLCFFKLFAAAFSYHICEVVWLCSGRVAEFFLKLFERSISLDLPLLEQTKFLDDLVFVKVLLGYLNFDLFTLSEEPFQED